ncbi:FAD-binding oxidoreductase [Achromobacter denitrificans]|uniref:FAD-binding oxidoreductase n=1 Tax=Achromobacter denitrificans TaxID=32002 RepID=UPI000B4D76A4|nr:FAD-binding oxidoreductase [Achromobacter denitrificans]ASC65085.1 FAD-binding oxidoreductase [Achromobacter denitrificans]
MSTVEVVSALQHTLGPDIVLPGASLAERRHADWSGLSAETPLALLRPRNTAQVSAALAICHRYRQPIVTQGGLTGLAGAACTRATDIALSLERMHAIEEIDPLSATLTAQAGATLESIQQAAAGAGLMFPLDLGARGSCTLGGNLATNAGGNRVIKYGMARDQVLGLEAVLADGSVLDGTHKMIKNNTGYDLRHLLIGSEGTLGVITRAVLRLRSPASEVATAFCGLGDYQAVTRLLSEAQQRLPTGVSAFEVMWPSFLDYMLAHVPGLRAPLDGRHAFYVLLESSSSGNTAQQAEFERFLGDMLESGVIDDAAIAQSRSDAAAFWRLRDATAEFPILMPDLIAFDVSFPIADIGAAALHCDAVLRKTWPASTVLTYGHLGDGNLHLIVQAPDSQGVGQDALAHAVEQCVYGIVSEYRGSVSAEHGIGLKKRDVLGHTRSPAEISAMRAIKAALDPHGILNPGKVLPPV